MPLTIPTLDDRKYQDLLDEALARIPVYTPEWTNFNKSDPGVTLIEVFAFLTESLLYRANQIPERNRKRFLQLLGIPLKAASSAIGLVTFSNQRGELEALTLNRGLEVRAGQVPFRTDAALDVLPIEGKLYYKREVKNPSKQLQEYYSQLYASYTGDELSATEMSNLSYYESVPFTPETAGALDLGSTVDMSLWVALLVRKTDKEYAGHIDLARKAIAGKTLNLGVVPAVPESGRRLAPGGKANPEGVTAINYEIPVAGSLPDSREPSYRALDASPSTDVLLEPGVVQITLPQSAGELALWDNLEPLEAGVGKFPPSFEDAAENDRLITWLRIRPSAAPEAKILWAGINAVFVKQRARVAGELLSAGTGEPDQVVALTRTPVIPESVELTVTVNSTPKTWERIEDLMNAGPEVPAPDPAEPPGTPVTANPRIEVFAVNAESGEIRFGDGTRGKRPPAGAILRATYDYGLGRAGNVGANTITAGPALPEGIQVNNPVRTWGGAEAETVSQGEKQIARHLQNRDRLVTAEDFATLTARTPGVDVGRVEVLPAFNPEISKNEPGDAPGTVTLMVIPTYDTDQPDAPVPRQPFLDAICSYLDPRRLVTTEIYLRGPNYRGIWVSVGIDVTAGSAIAQVREDVKSALLQFLSPLPPPKSAAGNPGAVNARGWPLRKAVVALQLAAIASRVDGVLQVNNVLVAETTGATKTQIDLKGLDLPRVLGISVAVGDPAGIEQLRGPAPAATTGAATVTPKPPSGGFVPVPVIPEECGR